MLTLLGSLLGLLGSMVPDVLKMFRDSADKKHELKILELQMQQQATGHTQRLEEIKIQADISESKALYDTYTTHITWVDALNGSVRPVIAYCFFLLYATVKLTAVYNGLAWQAWTEEDAAIFAGIMSFYFGQRAMTKLRGK